MDRGRKGRKKPGKEYWMYIFTFLLCIFTVAAAAWMIGGGKSGQFKEQGSGPEGHMYGAGGAAGEGNQADAAGEAGNARPAAGGSLAGIAPAEGAGAVSEGESPAGTALAEGVGAVLEGESSTGTAPAEGTGAVSEGESSAGTALAEGAGTVSQGGSPAGTAAEEGAGAAGEAPDMPRSGEKPEITLVMAGDILLHTPVAESGKKEDGTYDFSAIFAEMKEEIQAADLALVNQEVIIGGEELGVSGYPAFNAPYELGDALVDAGFDVVLHGTNHALDKGKKGILNCLSFWRENHPGIAVLGIHESEAAQQEIYVYEQEGIRLAILNYTYGTNGIALPQDMPYAVDLLERERVAEDLRRAQELADFVVVCPHWGTEYVLEETAQQREWALFFAENGADLILGTHPHVIEPVEWVGAPVNGTDGNAASASAGGAWSAGTESGTGIGGGSPAEGTLVYYSLGNFVNWTSGTGEGVADRMVGGLARVTIGLDDSGEAVVTSYGVEPLACHVERGFGGVRVYPLERYTEALAGRNEIVSQDSSFSLDYCQKLVRNVFGTLVDK